MHNFIKSALVEKDIEKDIAKKSKKTAMLHCQLVESHRIVSHYPSIPYFPLSIIFSPPFFFIFHLTPKK